MGELNAGNYRDNVTQMNQAQKDEHFRHLYDDQPNFKALAKLDPDFAVMYVRFQQT